MHQHAFPLPVKFCGLLAWVRGRQLPPACDSPDVRMILYWDVLLFLFVS